MSSSDQTLDFSFQLLTVMTFLKSALFNCRFQLFITVKDGRYIKEQPALLFGISHNIWGECGCVLTFFNMRCFSDLLERIRESIFTKYSRLKVVL